MNKTELQKQIELAINEVRRITPLAQSLTNYVTMNFVANAQLAIGGTAAMTHIAEEAIALNRVADATYINVGTLVPLCGDALPRAAQAAVEFGKPWVLDPVAAGLGDLRHAILQEMKAYKPTVIRGNASEIIELAKQWELLDVDAKGAVGVDAKDSVGSATNAAIALAKYTCGAVAVSGDVDLVTDGELVCRLEGGSPLLTRITGSGCALGGIIATYACVATPLVAALTGHLMFNRAAEIAEQECQGPASFQVAFLDALYRIDAQFVANS